MATILQISNADRNLSSFCKALRAVGLEDTLREKGPFTILGPNNVAFGQLLAMDFDEFLDPVHAAALTDLLCDHILVGKNMLTDFRDGQTLKTIKGKDVIVTIKNNEVHINGARMLARDWQGTNGVVHVLETMYAVRATHE
jgi:uncharacterized surface protein with fasciclin (FAS1) repeats